MCRFKAHRPRAMNDKQFVAASAISAALVRLSSLPTPNHWAHRAARLKEAYGAFPDKETRAPSAISYEIRTFFECALRVINPIDPITVSFTREALEAIDELIEEHVEYLGIQWPHENSDAEEDQ